MILQKILPLQGKFFHLCLIAFGSGAAVMAMELIISRILTPVFGSSTYTWGSLIGLVLTGLSLGYFLGGRIADKDPKFKKICAIIFSAGLYIVFIPFIAPGVLGFTLTALPQNQFSSLFATFILVFFPTTLLGFVSPYVIKLGTEALHKVGNISGTLYSISTAGSIFGTFLTIFVLIPTMDVRTVLFGVGVVLMIMSLLGLKTTPKIITVAVIIILFTPSSSLVTGFMPHIGTLVIEKETPYSHLDVVDSDNTRTMYLNGLRHSQMDKDNPNDLLLTYSKYFHLGQLFNPQLEKILFVGGGGFSGPKNFLETYPDSLIDVVEIDPDVIEAAKTYFFLKDNPRLKIFNEDARTFLMDSDKKYDLIILDAYAADYVPFHLLTQEYFQILNDHLEPGGVVVSNLIGSLEGDTSDLPRSVYKTMKNSFPTVYVFTTNEVRIGNIQNLIFVATQDKVQFDRIDLESLSYQNKANNLLSDINYLENYYPSGMRTDNVSILTDDFSPVEIMINPVTSQPFFNEGSVFSQESKIWFSESTPVKIGLLITIVFVWLTLIRGIWKDSHAKII
ncbi:MAG: fused MFS/spermidine synthase [Nitrosarchaeum sp.]|nr:fused MFS/spermidine synthase [Nitrosarchaeum sp.]